MCQCFSRGLYPPFCTGNVKNSTTTTPAAIPFDKAVYSISANVNATLLNSLAAARKASSRVLSSLRSPRGLDELSVNGLNHIIDQVSNLMV